MNGEYGERLYIVDNNNVMNERQGWIYNHGQKIWDFRENP